MLLLQAKRSRRLIKEGSWIVLGQLMMIAGSLVGVRLLTELLSPDAYGQLALGMTIATLVNQIVLGPLGGGIIRFYAHAMESSDLAGYFNAAKKMTLLATGVIFLIILFSSVGLIVAEKIKWLGITISALVFATLSGYCANFSGIQTAARQRAIVAMHQGAEPLLRSLIAAGLLIWLGATSTIAMIGYVIASLFVLASQGFFFRKIYPVNTFSDKKNNWQDKIWKFSWPIGIFGVFTWLQLASDRWALQTFSSTSEVGSYAVLYQIGYYPISLLSGMAMQFLVPILYQRSGDASDNERNAAANKLSWQLTWVTLIITMTAVLVAFMLHKLIFQILVAQKYSSVSHLLPWMILSGGMFAAGQSLASNLQAKLKTRELMAAKIITALSGVAFNFIGAYWYGITGIVCAGLLFSIMFLLWMALLVNREGEGVRFC